MIHGNNEESPGARMRALREDWFGKNVLHKGSGKRKVISCSTKKI